MRQYVIVGNSAGAVGAIEAIRQADQDGSIAVVSEEDTVAYSRPAISELLCGAKDFPAIVYRPESFYHKHGVQMFFGQRAAHIDVPGRRLALEDGSSLAFDRLLLATGGKPIIPPLAAEHRQGVYTFTTVDDARRLRQHVESGAKRVVVIGGGLIGTSVSEALARAGANVTIVELRERVLSLLLDEAGSRIVANAMESQGIRLACGQTADRFLARADDGRSIGGVALHSGERLDCDAVVLAMGVRPRTELAVQAGIEVNRGILVDETMQTSAEGIYACGDVAEAYDFIFGGRRVVPIWPGAYLGGRVAGTNMADGRARFNSCTVMNSVKYFGLAIVSAGDIESEGRNGDAVYTRTDGERDYRKVVVRDGRIVGFVLSENIERAGILFALLRERVDVTAFGAKLTDPNFDLADLPREWWQGHYNRATRLGANGRVREEEGALGVQRERVRTTRS